MTNDVLSIISVLPVTALILLFQVQRAAIRRGKPIPTSRLVYAAVTSIAATVLISMLVIDVISAFSTPTP